MPPPAVTVPSVSAAAPAQPAAGPLIPERAPAPAPQPADAGRDAPSTAASSADAAGSDAEAPAPPDTQAVAARSAGLPIAPERVHAQAEPVDIQALLAAADGGSRVVARGVRRGPPPTMSHPASAAMASAAMAPAASAPPVQGRPTSGPATRPIVRARSTVSEGAPRVTARPAGAPPPRPAVRGARVAPPAPPTPSHAVTPPVVVAQPADPHRGPTPSAAQPAGARMVPMQAPQSAEDVARLLGGRAPTPPGPPAPTPSPAQPTAAPHGPVELAPAQIRTIAGVVEQRVIRHIEQERARTRTRV